MEKANSAEQALLRRRDTPAEFWAKIKGGVSKKLEETFDFQKLALGGMGPEAIEAKKQDFLRREEIFVVQVLTKSQKALNQKGPDNVFVLFDVDETMGTPVYTEPTKVKTILRPSLAPLLGQLKSLPLHIGILSSRGKEHLLKQIHDPDHLALVQDHFDESLVFTSQSLHSDDSLEFGKTLKAKFGGPQGIIDDAKLDVTDPYRYPTVVGSQTKIMALNQIHKDFPEKAIVAIDDLSFPGFLNENNGMFGVSLKEEGGAFYKL